ncbi:MAG: ATP-binding protein [Acidobacteriota bacterium]
MSTLPVVEKPPRDLLLEAFSSFNEISSALEEAYRNLTARVAQLSAELERSNYYLSTLLENLPCGVLVVQRDRRVSLINEAARRFFRVEEDTAGLSLEEVLRDASFGERAEVFSTADRATEIRLPGNPDRILLCWWAALRDGERVLVVQDVTRLRLLEEKIRETERLAAMGEVALEVAHEIRNPLGALELFASLLAEEELSEEERSLYVENIRIGVRSLNTVVNNMLCLRRIPAVEWQLVRIGRVLAETGRWMEPLFEQRGIELITECRDEKDVRSDPALLRQIFMNLLTNAVQALPEGGKILLRSGEDQGRVFVEVQDNGVGIPPHYKELVFDSGFSLSRGGTGLGLAIVKRLADELGIAIELDSEPGRGTCFRLRFAEAEKAS